MFGKKNTSIYLDWASAAPARPEALSAFLAAQEVFGNPGSPHNHGVRAKHILDDARTTIARLASTKPESVVFTSGATEANNLSIQGYIHAQMEKTELKDMHVLYLSSAHASTVGVVEEFGKAGVQIEAIALEGARINKDAFKKQIRPETILVVMEAVCGETGTQFDTRQVRRILDAVSPEKRIMLHVDASQLPFVGSFEHTHLGADMIVLDAQKVGGIRGIGALILPKKLPLIPLTIGGGQQQGIRPGTEVPALAASFAAALISSDKERADFVATAMKQRTQLVTDTTTAFPDAVVNGDNQAPHILNMSFPGRDTDYLLALMDTDGFSVATKSACDTDSAGSRAVLAFTKDESLASSTLRISWGSSTKAADFKAATRSLLRNLGFLDRA